MAAGVTAAINATIMPASLSVPIIFIAVMVAVDQMRYDYLPRFASDFTDGLALPDWDAAEQDFRKAMVSDRQDSRIWLAGLFLRR